MVFAPQVNAFCAPKTGQKRSGDASIPWQKEGKNAKLQVCAPRSQGCHPVQDADVMPKLLELSRRTPAAPGSPLPDPSLPLGNWNHSKLFLCSGRNSRRAQERGTRPAFRVQNGNFSKKMQFPKPQWVVTRKIGEEGGILQCGQSAAAAVRRQRSRNCNHYKTFFVPE